PLTLVLPFFFTSPSTILLYPLSLHDALPISLQSRSTSANRRAGDCRAAEDRERQRQSAARHRHRAEVTPIWRARRTRRIRRRSRSEEHTSELQSLRHLVCRLLLEKKKTKKI